MAVVITRTANPAGANSASGITTYATQAIGAASADRVVAVCIGKEHATAVVSSVTIDFGGGDVAMRLANGTTFAAMGAHIYWLGVPTGTTATFKVTWSAAVLAAENNIAIYTVTDGAAPPLSSGSDTSTDMDATDPLTTGSITIPTNGGVLAVAAGATDGTAKTWANITEDLDIDAGGFRMTTAFRTTGGTVTGTCTGGTNGEDGALAWAIFAQASLPELNMAPLVPAAR